MKLFFACRACRATGHADIEPEAAAEVTLEHESDCPFLFALETGTSEEWTLRHGQPIRIAILDEDSYD